MMLVGNQDLDLRFAGKSFPVASNSNLWRNLVRPRFGARHHKNGAAFCRKAKVSQPDLPRIPNLHR